MKDRHKLDLTLILLVISKNSDIYRKQSREITYGYCLIRLLHYLSVPKLTLNRFVAAVGW